MLKNLGTTEFVVIGVIAVLLFGSKKLTGVARELGKSSKEYKKTAKEVKKALDEEPEEEEEEEKEEEK